MHPIGSSTEHSVIFSVLASTAESVIFDTFERTNGNSTRERQPYSNALHEHSEAANHEVGSTALQSNKSISNAKSGPGLEESLYRTLFIIISYTLIIFVSLCGNILVLRVIFSRRKLHTTTNLLIASLACADLLTTTLNVPFNVSRFLSLNYPFPAVFCKLVPFIQVACVYVSTLTMGVIAIHRHITLSCPHRAYNSTSGPSGGNLSAVRAGTACRLGAMTVVVWLVAAMLAVPHSMFNQIVYVPWRNVTYVRCRAEYPKWDEKFNLPFWLSVEAFLTQYLIPLSITCTLYIKIGFVVSKQGRLASNSNNRRKKEQDDARRRRIIMLAMVVLVFALCWFPLNLYHILVDFRVVKPNFNVFLVCHWIAMSSVCYNPFIYCWLNESFRKGAIKMLSFACICCSKTIGNGDIDPDTDGLEITTTGNTTLMTSVNNNCKRQSVVLDNNNGDNGNCQFKRIAEQQLSTAETEVNCSSPANERHEENCPKTMKAATNCQKEKRKFRKLRLSSFRKNAAHHHHHHNYNHNHNHNHNHNQQTQHHCNCKSILSNSVIEKNGCCLESANGSANAPSSTKHGTVVQTGDMRAEMISSGGTTTLTTARATCLASKAATTSCSLESVASSHNSSNGSSSSGRSGSNSCAGQQSSSGSSCSASAGAFNAGKPTAGVTVCNHNGNGCSSLEENAAAAVAAVSSGCIQVNVSLSVQPCDTVATTASSTLNKSTFV